MSSILTVMFIVFILLKPQNYFTESKRSPSLHFPEMAPEGRHTHVILLQRTHTCCQIFDDLLEQVHFGDDWLKSKQQSLLVKQSWTDKQPMEIHSRTGFTESNSWHFLILCLTIERSPIKQKGTQTLEERVWMDFGFGMVLLKSEAKVQRHLKTL